MPAPGVTSTYAPKREKPSFESAIFVQSLFGIVGTRRLITTSREQEWGQEKTVAANDENGEMLHGEEIGSFGTRESSSLCKSAKGASTAGGWQKTTKLRGKKGRLRQMLRNLRLSRLRFTALPSLRRTTKIGPRGVSAALPSRPQRIQRQWPLIQAIKL